MDEQFLMVKTRDRKFIIWVHMLDEENIIKNF